MAAGGYRATVYVYASAPNAAGCLERAGTDEPLGAWFRRTRAGEEMPAWLHNALVNDPSEDPGHAKEWKRAQQKRGGQVIDLLVHLEPASGSPEPAPIESESWALAGEARRPEPFPLGLAASFADPVEEPAPPPPAPPLTAPAEGLSRIVGGPVDVPVAKLARVFRIAWFCHPYTVPRLRVELPQGAKRPPDPDSPTRFTPTRCCATAPSCRSSGATPARSPKSRCGRSGCATAKCGRCRTST